MNTFDQTKLAERSPRAFCHRCLKSARTCLCTHMEPIETSAQFVLLMHRKEQRDRPGTGTGRLSHLMLKGSRLFTGIDFDRESEIKALLQNEHLFPCTLFPGKDAMDVSTVEGMHTFQNQINKKIPLVFVLDASWPCARKMIKQNPLIGSLPRISFSTGRTSNFGFKRQPQAECLSTIESIHEVLEQFESMGHSLTLSKGSHDNLLTIFNRFITLQSQFCPPKWSL